MTINQLIKKLEKIKEKHPRAMVLVDWESLSSDDYTHGLVNTVHSQWINWRDDDGGTGYNKDGSERQKFVVVLS